MTAGRGAGVRPMWRGRPESAPASSGCATCRTAGSGQEREFASVARRSVSGGDVDVHEFAGIEIHVVRLPDAENYRQDPNVDALSALIGKLDFGGDHWLGSDECKIEL